MAERRPGFPRMNLAKESVTELGFTWTLERGSGGAVPHPLADLLRDGPFFSVTAYRRSRAWHNLSESVYATDSDRPLRLGVRYATGRDAHFERVPESLNRGGDLFERLAHFPEHVTIECVVDFGVPFKPGERTGLWFPLPVPLSNTEGGAAAPISEIRGVRGVKLIERGGEGIENVEYGFILDRPGNSDVSLSINFYLHLPISDQTPYQVLAKARTIARRLGIFQSKGGD